MRTRYASGAIAAAAVTAVAVVGGIAVVNRQPVTIAGSGSTALLVPIAPGGSGSSGNGSSGNGSSGNGSSGNGPGTPPDGSRRMSTDATAASAAQQVGIVTVVSVLKYQNAEGAGTGMILTSNGEVLTNNHVVNGATSITVTVESTGKSYRADVVGTAPTSDVAVLQLRNASGLQTARLAGSSSPVSVGDGVTGVGNAGGTGTLTAVSGKVTALNQSITASDGTGGESEHLTGLIEVNAAIIAGDSGGPLYNAAGQVIGMDTAASTRPAATPTAYAIPIQSAVGISTKIESGVETAAIHIGYPGFLGIGTQDSAAGAGVTGVLAGGPAAKAGITTGSTITAIDGKSVSSAKALRAVLTAKNPGSSVNVTWTGRDGASHTASVTLATGPAD
jgi:S1-C subfamily serine protease